MRPSLVTLLVALTAFGCAPGPKSAQGFHLPDGDAAAGKEAFTQMNCTSCHAVEGVELPEVERTLDVRLGGEVHRVRTYGQLVTAIIHPSHDITRTFDRHADAGDGTSPMTDINETMTVQQLIDLVAFLQPTYVEYVPEYTPYYR